MKKNVSKLSDHKIKKGLIITPFNDSFGDKLLLNSWSTERLPEYIWLALIHSYYGRTEGLNKSGQIINELNKLSIDITRPKFSCILGLDEEEKKEVFEIICKIVDPYILTPLTVLYRQKEYPLFNHYFYNRHISVTSRIRKLKAIIRSYRPHQSFEATDIRYLAMFMELHKGKIKIVDSLDSIIEAIKEYPYISHDDLRMRMYRPSIRNLESMDIESKPNQEFINNFWRELALMSECDLNYIDFEEEYNKDEEKINDIKKVLEYLIINNKEDRILEAKFEVIIGSAVYAYKLLKEVVDNNLYNKILGRHALRTLSEVFIMLKYLLKKEEEKTDVWKEYQYYGIGKYKAVLLKARDRVPQDIENHHILIPLLDAIVNEQLWEEFVDIDLRYFDQQSIRDKCIYIDEKDIYDFFYEYDTNYVHGLWGAVRESSMLMCDNSAHNYHTVPDINNLQELPSVQSNCIDLMNKIINLVCDIYQYPEWYINKYKKEETDDKHD